MEWIDAPESSNIVRFGYDDASRVLKVEFKSGSIYDYYDVPDQVFNGMRNAPSRGGFLAEQVKGTYRYARV